MSHGALQQYRPASVLTATAGTSDASTRSSATPMGATQEHPDSDTPSAVTAADPSAKTAAGGAAPTASQPLTASPPLPSTLLGKLQGIQVASAKSVQIGKLGTAGGASRNSQAPAGVVDDVDGQRVRVAALLQAVQDEVVLPEELALFPPWDGTGSTGSTRAALGGTQSASLHGASVGSGAVPITAGSTTRFHSSSTAVESIRSGTTNIGITRALHVGARPSLPSPSQSLDSIAAAAPMQLQGQEGPLPADSALQHYHSTQLVNMQSQKQHTRSSHPQQQQVMPAVYPAELSVRVDEDLPELLLPAPSPHRPLGAGPVPGTETIAARAQALIVTRLAEAIRVKAEGEESQIRAEAEEAQKQEVEKTAYEDVPLPPEDPAWLALQAGGVREVAKVRARA